MVWLVFIIGLLNLAVGFAVAIYVDRLREVPAVTELMQKKPAARPEVKPARKPKPAHVPDDGPMLADDDAPPTEEIPDEWLEQLDLVLPSRVSRPWRRGLTILPCLRANRGSRRFGSATRQSEPSDRM